MMVKLIGAGIGLVLAIVELAFLQRLSERVELEETRKVLRTVGFIQLLILPLVGWFVAPLVVGDA